MIFTGLRLSVFAVFEAVRGCILISLSEVLNSYDPALKEHRTVCFLIFDGHCYMYRDVKRVLERQAARGRPSERRFDAADVQPGLWCDCGLRLRRGTRIRELEEHEVLQRWCKAGQGGKCARAAAG